MNRRHHFPFWLPGILLLFLGCAPRIEKSVIPGSSDDPAVCSVIFPTEPWESVHKIEATLPGMFFSILLGVTRGDPSAGKLHSLLLTPEGFILFESELRDGQIRTLRAMAPFDTPAFARGLMEDVTLLFLSAQGKPASWRKEGDGRLTCLWKDPHGFLTQIKGSMELGWRIIRQDDQGNVTREVSLKGPFVHGVATHMELRAFKPAPYNLRMTLIAPNP